MKSNTQIRILASLALVTMAVLSVLSIWQQEKALDKQEATTGSDSRVIDLKSKGWLPPWFPIGAHNITLSQDLETSNIECSFQYSGKDITTLGACERTSYTEVYPDRIPPAALSGNVLPSGIQDKLNSERLPFYICRWDNSGTTICLTEAPGGQFYLWRPSY